MAPVRIVHVENAPRIAEPGIKSTVAPELRTTRRWSNRRPIASGMPRRQVPVALPGHRRGDGDWVARHASEGRAEAIVGEFPLI